MTIDAEVRDLRMRLNSLREQNEKLQGSIKSLQATNENLQLTIETTKEKANQYKKAFEEVFIHNIGNGWERFSDEQKAKMSLSDKVSFFNREVNFAKIYIRDMMERRHQKDVAALHTKIEELEKSNKDLASKASAVDAEINNTKKDRASTSSMGKNTEVEDRGTDKSFLKHNSAPKTDGKPKQGFMPFMNSDKSADELKKDLEAKRKQPKQTMSEGMANVLKSKGNSTVNKEALSKESKKEAEYTKDDEAQEIDLKMLIPQKRNIRKKLMEMQSDIRKKVISDATKNFIELDETKRKRFARILFTFGATGEFTVSDIYNDAQRDATYYHLNRGTKTNEKRILRGLDVQGTSIYKMLQGLNELGYIESGEKIKMGTGSPVTPYFLSTNGNYLFALLFETDPVISKLELVSKLQKSTSHGVHIQQVFGILTANGYSCKEEDSKITDDGKETICDILASKNGFEYRIEYEEGNYSEKGYDNKFRNILNVTDFLIFITYNTEAKGKLLRYFNSFKNDNPSLMRGKHWLFTTLSEFKADPNMLEAKKQQYMLRG